MSEIPKNLAVFNIEGTIMEDTMGGALERMGQVDPSSVRGIGELPTQVVPQRRLMTGWLKDKPEGAVDPLQKAAKESAVVEVAPWARVVMGAEAAAGSEIQIYSSNIPHPIAVGIGQGVAEMTDTWVHASGVSLRMDEDNRYTGEWSDLYKTETVEHREAEGYRVVTAADSRASGRRVLEKAERQILVSPEKGFTRRPLSDRAFTVNWDEAETELTLPDGTIHTYDLADMAQHEAFLSDLGYTPSS